MQQPERLPRRQRTCPWFKRRLTAKSIWQVAQGEVRLTSYSSLSITFDYRYTASQKFVARVRLANRMRERANGGSLDRGGHTKPQGTFLSDVQCPLCPTRISSLLSSQTFNKSREWCGVPCALLCPYRGSCSVEMQRFTIHELYVSGPYLRTSPGTRCRGDAISAQLASCAFSAGLRFHGAVFIRSAPSRSNSPSRGCTRLALGEGHCSMPRPECRGQCTPAAWLQEAVRPSLEIGIYQHTCRRTKKIQRGTTRI